MRAAATMRFEYKHSLVSRWAHWINFPLLGIMIWSGLLIYWANDVYRVGVGQFTAFHFFPDSVYRVFDLDHRLAEGMAVHFFFMWLFAINGLFYVSYTLASGEWRDLVPNRTSLSNAIKVTLHELGLRNEAPPQGKYNAAQQLAYTGVILMGAGSLVTGCAIYKPVQLAWLTSLLGGYQMARFLHFWLTLGFLAFFVIHIVQVTRAGWRNFQSMISGLELGSVNGAPGANRQLSRHNRRAFLGFAGAAGVAVVGWEWLWSRPVDDSLPYPFRRVLDWNGNLESRVLFDERHVTPQFPAFRIGKLRPNGDLGLDDDLEESQWKLSVALEGSERPFELTMGDIRALPTTEQTTEFNCIEGWSTVTQWRGTRFRDFVAKYSPNSQRARFASLVTPDESYFVGIDMASMMHPQTLLCYEMNGRPLRPEHGAPLRLVIPVKYGIKNIKRIGKISFTNVPPPDYWAIEGYDYYAGL
ncbi:MAG TPA: molybdopterin-dependent oxidoreductase [Bryobacteraceae bacterium]|nr:molybdopterin-dependent oxidoreductase [Bryobacteraceae bacterium]